MGGRHGRIFEATGHLAVLTIWDHDDDSLQDFGLSIDRARGEYLSHSSLSLGFPLLISYHLIYSNTPPRGAYIEYSDATDAPYIGGVGSCEIIMAKTNTKWSAIKTERRGCLEWGEATGV